MTTTLRINLWSGPRNVSTALMYSFAQRADTRVVDEPLYAHYLAVSGAAHPGREDVLAWQDSNAERVVRHLILGASDRAILFFKQMAHHLVEVDRSFLAHTKNVLLIRDPRDMLPSLAQNLERPTLRDTGLAMQTELLDELVRRGQDPPIVDAKALVSDPRAILGELCRRLEIAFDEAMLSWQPGARVEDGIWARHWYANVHRSSGFEPYREKQSAFPCELEPLLAECRPHYERLLSSAIRARTTD